MKEYKKPSKAIIISILLLANSLWAKEKVTTIYFFESAICPHCKQANEYLAKNSHRFKQVKIIKYQLVNKNGVMDETNKKNLKILVSMLNAIQQKKGNTPFIYYERVAYEYYEKNGIPYYKSANRYSKKDEPIPVPLFIINDTVYLGFDQFVKSALEQL